MVLDALGTVLWSNPAAATFTGLDPAVWTGRSVLELLHPDDHASVFSAFDSVTSKGLGNLIDVRIRDAANQWRSCEIRGRYVEATTDSDAHIIVVFRDTSDRQMLELGRGDSEYLRAIVHHASALLATLSDTGTIITANAELDRLLGHDLDVIAGKEFCDLLVADDRALFRDTLVCIHESDRVEVRAEGRDANIVYLDVWITDLRADPLVEGYTLSATDITDLKKPNGRFDTWLITTR